MKRCEATDRALIEIGARLPLVLIKVGRAAEREGTARLRGLLQAQRDLTEMLCALHEAIQAASSARPPHVTNAEADAA